MCLCCVDLSEKIRAKKNLILFNCLARILLVFYFAEALARPTLEELPLVELLTPAEAADFLGISVRTLRAHVRSGELAFINLGRGQVRKRMAFTRQDLEDFINSRRMRQGAAEPVRRAMRGRQAEPVGLDFAALRAKRKEERRRK